MQINVRLIIHERLCVTHLYSDRIKRNIFGREQSIKLAREVLQLISVGKNSKVKLNFGIMLHQFNTQMAM